ncbi:MAG: hypothetical protein FJ290_26940, partial [Planctomycetes bacterium]|nr:hypothetical protein [Planctomycetota bacterium]
MNTAFCLDIDQAVRSESLSGWVASRSPRRGQASRSPGRPKGALGSDAQPNVEPPKGAILEGLRRPLSGACGNGRTRVSQGSLRSPWATAQSPPFGGCKQGRTSSVVKTLRPSHLVLLGAFLMAAVQQALGAAPTAEEMVSARRWVAARFEAAEPAKRAEPGLLVLANNDAVVKNNRHGKPLKLADRQFTRGLFCHAVSKVVVRLPGPGKAFSAVVGVDSNEQTSGGRGSVVFWVSVGGKEAFKSGVLREGMPPVNVAVDLGGATEFNLDIGDAGDGISCDQSDWADAKVVLADGKEVWLGDMPFIEEAGLLASGPPFSFTYGGQPSAALLPTWDRKQASRKLDDARTEHVVTYTDPKTGLVLRCVAIEYHDFPTVEWTLHFRNTGKAEMPVLADIQALDAQIVRSGKQEFLLHHAVGSPCSKNDYGPLLTELKPNATKRIAAAGGRPTNSDMSYFNLEWGGEGLIVVVGWPGQWAATFARNGGTGLRIRAGQELTHFKLLPGEDVRSPLMVLQFWKGGDWIRAQNLWRRWMMAH